MEFKFLHLTKKEECDQLITVTEKEKAILVYRRQGLMMKDADSAGAVAEIQAELLAKIAEVAANQAFVDTMPDGAKKDAAILKLKKLTLQKDVLEARQKSRGAVSILENEYDIDAMERRIAGAESFIEAVTNRKNEL
jgi:hypothetical protein